MPTNTTESKEFNSNFKKDKSCINFNAIANIKSMHHHCKFELEVENLIKSIKNKDDEVYRLNLEINKY